MKKVWKKERKKVGKLRKRISGKPYGINRSAETDSGLNFVSSSIILWAKNK